MSIPAHGGTLVNRTVQGAQVQQLLEEYKDALRVPVSYRVLSDAYLIGVGALSPLEGFMGKDDYQNVVEQMRLATGLVFSIPVTLTVPLKQYRQVVPGDEVLLTDAAGTVYAIMAVQEKFERDIEREAVLVYRTDDRNHPGVAKLFEEGPYVLAGPIRYFLDRFQPEFPEHTLTPAETRAAFQKRGWKTIVAFQTRNPMHRAHEYLTKCALEIVDGLLIHPLVGETKSDDIPAAVRMECYQALIRHYYPQDRVMLSVLPAAMRYAGPREAIFHAILRKNYGCTHFIVGRDHAGVGNYYGTYDAQRIFDEVDPEQLQITPLMFEHAFWCTVTGGMATTKTSPSMPEQRIFLSGTKVRQLLREGKPLPPEFTRPEVAQILQRWAQGQ